MSQHSKFSLDLESVTGLHWVATALVVATGALHLYAGVAEGKAPLILAGLGYAGATVLFLINYRRRLLYLVGIAYTFVQFPIWFAVKAGEYTTVGYTDKAIQAGLIVLLAYLYWQQD